jgi:ribose transport system permease protein
MSRILVRLASDYGMVFVLMLICGYLSWATYGEQSAAGVSGGRQVAEKAIARGGHDAKVLIVAGKSPDDAAFANAAAAQLGPAVVGVVKGEPQDARADLQKIVDRGGKLDVIAATQSAAAWSLIENVGERFPQLRRVEIITPQTNYWPSFLTAANLLNIANQTAVRAVIAIGMTMVILTGGIDLSVGSLIGLSSVCAALVIQNFGGGRAAGPGALILGSLVGISVCGLCGLFSGLMVTAFRIPAFIVTLAVMQVARGLAFRLTGGESIAELPETFKWLGHGTNLGIPNSVWLMIVLYIAAYVLMTRTIAGRYIYAVGGNEKAARLSGVPVERILILVYTACGALAGLGGIMTASLLESGDPKFGMFGDELYVISAVVIGGTSLAGGEGKIFGTLIGALLIAVISNGMNMLGVDQFTQMIVLGIVILLAVLLDSLKKQSWWRKKLDFGSKQPT